MAAYASLLSLTQTLEQILQWRPHDRSQLFLDEEQLQLRSLHEKLSNALLFLENSSPKINSETTSSLEGRIRDAAYEAKDLVESHMASKSVAVYEAEDVSELLMAREAGSFQRVVTSRYQKITSVLQRYARCFVSTTTSQTFEESLQNVIEKLSSISEEVEEMKANNINGDEALHPFESKATTLEMEGVDPAIIFKNLFQETKLSKFKIN